MKLPRSTRNSAPCVTVSPTAETVQVALLVKQALDAFDQVPVSGRRCLDAGASTGGFTDVLLRRGAAHVVAVEPSARSPRSG